VSEPLDTTSWPSQQHVILPSRAFLTSWLDQTLPARAAALADAVEHARALADSPASGTRDMALLAVVSDAMQPLEDLAYLMTAWSEPFQGIAKYVRATAYSARTPTNFWQQIHKRDDDYLDVVAGFASRRPDTGGLEEILDALGGTSALSTDVLKALNDARRATRSRLRMLLAVLAESWAKFGDYFYAYKHGGLIVNRSDAHWYDDVADESEIDKATPERDPSLAVWHRGGKAMEGRGEFSLSADQIIREADGPGRMAIELAHDFIRSRVALYDALDFGDDGSITSLKPMQLPWTVWLREAELPPETWNLIGAGPRITWTPDDRTPPLP
jgi:hypothetical protein